MHYLVSIMRKSDNALYFIKYINTTNMRETFYKIVSFLVSVTIVFGACTKETADVRLDPKLSTSQVQSLTSDSVNIVGFVVASGSGFTEKGVCFNTAGQPTTADNKVVYNGQGTTANFIVKIKTTRLTKYYARAYAMNAGGTIYGDEMSFKTPAALPSLANISASVLAATPTTGVTATTGVNITDDGGPDKTANISARGVVFGWHPHVTLDSITSKLVTNRTIATTEGTGKGQFTSLATNLKGNVTYYLRAYATNSIGSSYSNEISFKTPVAYASILTNPVTLVTKTTATFNGKFTYDGGGTVTERGFVYGLTENPTITAGTKVPVATASDSTITYNVTGLTLNTNYHVRSYVTNQTGTNYGADVPFTTLADIIKFWVVGDYNGWDNSDNAKYIISTTNSAGAAEGYVYLTSGGIKLTTDHSWDNQHTFGDDGTNKGILSNVNGGKNITVASSGYYLIKANISNMTYSLTLTTWGIIGDATAGGWGTQTDMVYNSTSQTFSLAAHLTSGGAFKFRGTSDWNVNYGSDKADGTLNAGGANIPVTATGDYAITLDLSHPNAYTYSANRWSLIGDAATDWNTDIPLTWDATNKVFTATLNLKASGSFKFRANADWTYALGGTLNALSSVGGAANLTVAADGNYTVTLDPWALVATVKLN